VLVVAESPLFRRRLSAALSSALELLVVEERAGLEVSEPGQDVDLGV